MKDNLTAVICSVIAKSIDYPFEKIQFNDDLTAYGLDSISFIKLVVLLEETFNCEVPDSKLLISEMNTVKKILEVIEKLV